MSFSPSSSFEQEEKFSTDQKATKCSHAFSDVYDIPTDLNPDNEFGTFLPKPTLGNEVKQISAPALDSDCSFSDSFEENSLNSFAKELYCKNKKYKSKSLSNSFSSKQNKAPNLTMMQSYDDSYSNEISSMKKQKLKKEISADSDFDSSSNNFISKQNSKVKTMKAPKLDMGSSSSNEFIPKQNKKAKKNKTQKYEQNSLSSDSEYISKQNNKSKTAKTSRFDSSSSSFDEFIPKQNNKTKTTKIQKYDLNSTSSSNEFVPKQSRKTKTTKINKYDLNSTSSSNEFVPKQSHKTKTTKIQKYDMIKLSSNDLHPKHNSNSSSDYYYSSSDDFITPSPRVNKNSNDPANSDNIFFDDNLKIRNNATQRRVQKYQKNRASVAFTPASRNSLLFSNNVQRNEPLPNPSYMNKHSKPILNLTLPPSMEAHMNIQLPPIPQPCSEAIVSKYRDIYNPQNCLKLIKDQPT